LTRHYAHWPPGVPHTLEVADCNLFSHLEASARRVPDKAAVVYYGRQTSFRELHVAALALAGYLQQRLGVRRGDRVLLMMQSCPQFFIAYYAVMRCDAVVVAMNPMSTREEIAFYAKDSNARILVTTQDLTGKSQGWLDEGVLEALVVGAASEFAGTADEVPYLEIPAFVREPRHAEARAGVHEFAGALACGIAPGPMHAGGRDLAVVGYTSGTTGRPKGAMLTHRN